MPLKCGGAQTPNGTIKFRFHPARTLGFRCQPVKTIHSLFRDARRLREPRSINVRNHHRCRSDGKGDDCKSKSDESQATGVRDLGLVNCNNSSPCVVKLHRSNLIQKHTETILRYLLRRDLQSRPASNPVGRFEQPGGPEPPQSSSFCLSPPLRREAIQIREAAACQLFWIAFTATPFFA